MVIVPRTLSFEPSSAQPEAGLRRRLRQPPAVSSAEFRELIVRGLYAITNIISSYSQYSSSIIDLTRYLKMQLRIIQPTTCMIS